MPDKQLTIYKTVGLSEYDEQTVARHELSFLTEKEMTSLALALKPLVQVSTPFNSRDLLLKSDSKVGVVTHKGLRVQVLPRVSAGEFCDLVRYALSGRIDYQRSAVLANLSWNTGFENALCHFLCDEVKEILRLGISRRYEERREPLEVIRGRVVWEKNFPWRGAFAKEINCRHYRLTYNNIDNRLLLAGLKKAFSLVYDDDVASRVMRFFEIFAHFCNETHPHISDFEQAGQNYNKLNEHYRIAHELSKMLLFGLRPESFFDQDVDPGAKTVSGVVLNMADLFEKFAEQYFSDLLSPLGLTVKPQVSDKRALIDAQGASYAAVRPDIEVWQNTNPIGIIDAKYKFYWKANPENMRPDKKISNGDLYQLFFYQQRMQKKYQLPDLPITMIAAPLPETDERNNVVCIADRYRHISWRTEAISEADVRLVLIPMTRFIRNLQNGVNKAEALNEADSDNVKACLGCVCQN